MFERIAIVFIESIVSPDPEEALAILKYARHSPFGEAVGRSEMTKGDGIVLSLRTTCKEGHHKDDEE